jgi:hypothetical protein
MGHEEKDFKRRPLREPGQSAGEIMMDLAFDKLLLPAMLMFFLAFFATFEWLHYVGFLQSGLPMAVILSAVALVAVVAGARRIRSGYAQIRMWRQGREGERAAGQTLEKARRMGYEVFHDVLFDGFNIDHVLVGPAGIFAVETKNTRTKATIHFDGQTVAQAGHRPQRGPIEQAAMAARDLAFELHRRTDRQFKVHPIVLYPQHMVEKPPPGVTPEVRVFNDTYFLSWLGSLNETMDRTGIELVASHMTVYVRERQEKEQVEK